MLRALLVFGLVLGGMGYAIRDGFGALLFYLWLAYFRPEEWVWSAAFLKTLRLSFLAGIIVLVRSPASDAKFRFDVRVLLLALMFVHSLASILMSPHREYAWIYWMDFAKATIITYMVSSHVVTIKKYRMVLFTIALSLGFEGAKQGWVQLLLSPGGKNENEIPLLGDNNGVAVGMLMLVGLFNALAQTAATKRERLFHRFFAVGVAYRAISTYSRGGFLSAATLALVAVMRSKQKVRGFIGVGVAATVILTALPSEFWDRMSTITVDESKMSAESADDASSAGRLHFWRVATDMAAANPIVGVGFNAYNMAYNEYDFLKGAFGRSRSVHSSWFGVLAELGYPGFILYVTILGMAVASTLQVARKARQGKAPPELYNYAVALQAGFAVAAVGGSFVPWQYCEMLWHFVGLSMGLRRLAEAPYEAPSVAKPAEAPVVMTGFRPQPATALRGA